MNYSLLEFAGAGALLLLALAWLSFAKLRHQPEAILPSRPEREWRHISYLPYIRQALSGADIEFLRQHGSATLARRAAKERRRIAIVYLSALRADFDRLLHFARTVALMSPEVEVVRELQGLRLHAGFSCRYYLIYLRLVCGVPRWAAIGHLSDMVSALTIQMEAAITELGERAALAADVSMLDGAGMDTR